MSSKNQSSDQVIKSWVFANFGCEFCPVCDCIILGPTTCNQRVMCDRCAVYANTVRRFYGKYSLPNWRPFVTLKDLRVPFTNLKIRNAAPVEIVCEPIPPGVTLPTNCSFVVDRPRHKPRYYWLNKLHGFLDK